MGMSIDHAHNELPYQHHQDSSKPRWSQLFTLFDKSFRNDERMGVPSAVIKDMRTRPSYCGVRRGVRIPRGWFYYTRISTVPLVGMRRNHAPLNNPHSSARRDCLQV